MKPYIIGGIVAGLCAAVAYRIGYADGRRPFKLDVQQYSSGEIIVYPTPTPVPCAPDYVWVPGTGLTTPTPKFTKADLPPYGPTPAPPRSVAKLKMKSGEWYWVEATCPANGFPTVEIRPWEEKR